MGSTAREAWDHEGGEPVKRATIRRVLTRGLTSTPKLWTALGESWSLVVLDGIG